MNGTAQAGGRGLIVAAPASGSGKTLLTLALLRHLRDAGRAVGAFKVGPDYIDPAFHQAACGEVSANIDAWAMRPRTVQATARRAFSDRDLVLGEGVMGLFDGAADGTGATADIAAQLGLPVLLVLDVRRQGGSAVAVAQGFARFRDDVDVVGVICNRVQSERHRAILAAAFDGSDIAVLGYVPELGALSLPSRHLGLVQASELANLEDLLRQAAVAVGRHLDVDGITALARAPALAVCDGQSATIPPLGQRIAVARDAAFSFAYDTVLSGWVDAGATVVPFSPLADEAPPADVDAVYLPGGYPELHAARLAANSVFLSGLRSAADRGATVYGECGGYMVLGRGLVDGEGRRHAMAGLLPLETSFQHRRRHLGYRQITLLADGPLGAAGTGFRGHEFHYATVLSEADDAPLFRAWDATGVDHGPCGIVGGRIAGSFIHLIDRADSPVAA